MAQKFPGFVNESIDISSPVLLPIVFGTLVYLLAYIASNKLQIKFYLKIIVGLVILLISYLATTALYGTHQLPKHLPEFSFGQIYAQNFNRYVWCLRPTATLLYTWQFFDVVYTQFNPSEKPVWFYIR